MLSATFLLAALAHAAVVRAGTYTLSDNWIGSAFLSTFQWQNIPDPTDGTVYALAISLLIFADF